MNFKLEYIILIILALMFYFFTLKDEIKIKNNKKFIKKNLKIGSKIITESKIIGEVVEINKNECLLITGIEDKNSYILIKLNSIESIIEA